MACPQRLTLPYPPSTNRYWRIFRGHAVRSAEATAYKRAVSAVCIQAGVDLLSGPVALEVRLYRPRKSGDLDNRLKVLLDALQGHLYADDAQVVELHAFRQDDKAAPRVELVLRPAGQPQDASGLPAPTPGPSEATAAPPRPPRAKSAGVQRQPKSTQKDWKGLAPASYPAKEEP